VLSRREPSDRGGKMDAPETPPRAVPAHGQRGGRGGTASYVVEPSPVFLPASPPMDAMSLVIGGNAEQACKEPTIEELVPTPHHMSLAIAPPPLPTSEMESLPFELKVTLASLLAYSDLVALRACSAELRAVAEHVLAQQSGKYFCCMGCSATISRPAEVFPMERRVGFEIVGAGTDDANGIYEPGVLPHYYGPPTWRKRGTNLFMFRWARTQWCLARLALDEPADNGHITDDWFLSNRLYVAPSGNPPCDEPPFRGWVPVRGASPAPASCGEAFLPVLHEELPAEEVGTHLKLLRTRHSVAPLCPVTDIEFEDSDLTLCGA
jgi:hypothetical protein